MLVFWSLSCIMLIINSIKLTMNNDISIEQYIEHEVKLRVLASKNDDMHKTFEAIDRRFDRLESKFESSFIMLVGLIITSIILPVVLHSLKLV